MSGQSARKRRQQTPLDWPRIEVERGRMLVTPPRGRACPVAVYWNAHDTPDEARIFDTAQLAANPDGYGRGLFASECGPNPCPAQHVMEVTRNSRGGIHYRLLHVVKGGVV